MDEFKWPYSVNVVSSDWRSAWGDKATMGDVQKTIEGSYEVTRRKLRPNEVLDALLSEAYDNGLSDGIKSEQDELDGCLVLEDNGCGHNGIYVFVGDGIVKTTPKSIFGADSEIKFGDIRDVAEFAAKIMSFSFKEGYKKAERDINDASCGIGLLETVAFLVGLLLGAAAMYLTIFGS